MIINAEFTSVWDGESTVVTTECKVNTETKEVFAIKVDKTASSMVDVLDYQYITIAGQEFPVYEESEKNDGEYWYR